MSSLPEFDRVVRGFGLSAKPSQVVGKGLPKWPYDLVADDRVVGRA